MKIIGLTGGIGSGKSTAAQCFSERGFPVIDMDAIGHRLLAQHNVIRHRVVELFGEQVLEESGAISRERLGALVFADAQARRQLNALLHPAIIEEVVRGCTSYAEEGHPHIIVEAALIGESGTREPWLSALILVLASEQVRVERLKRLRGMAEEEARRRIAAQSAPEKKMELADWILDNNDGMNALRRQVRVIEKAILKG